MSGRKVHTYKCKKCKEKFGSVKLNVQFCPTCGRRKPIPKRHGVFSLLEYLPPPNQKIVFYYIGDMKYVPGFSGTYEEYMEKNLNEAKK